MTVTDDLLGPLLRADAARPRITHYDDAAGSRVELSGATLANWAAKTANWLRDELDVQPGDPVAVLLPPHWQTAGVLLGAWWAGALVGAEADGAAVALCPVGRVADAAGADEVAALSLDALGAGLRTPPPGVHDYVGEARGHGDTFVSAGAGPDAAGVLAAVRARASDLGLGAEDRVLSTGGWDGDVPGEVLLAVLAAGGSLVQCSGTDPADLDRRAGQEKVTRRL